MESSEEESVEKYPSLPPNYVSLALLQKQWLQKQMKEQTVEERKDNQNQKQKQKQPEQEKGKLITASPSQPQEKGKKKFCEKEQGRERPERRRVEGDQKVHISKRILDGNRSKIGGAEGQSKSEGFKAKAPADHRVDGVGGMEEKKSRGKWKNNKRNKRVSGGNRSLIGVQENRENLGDLSWKNGGEEECRGEFGENSNGNREVEGKISVCMVGDVPEDKEKEEPLLGDKGFRAENWGNSVSVSAVESLPENESEMAGNGMLGAGSACTAEALPKLNVEEDCSVNVRRKRSKRRLKGRYQRNVDNPSQRRDSMDSKMELGYEEKVVEEGVFVEEDKRSGLQKERTARGTQAYGEKGMVAGNLSNKIRRDLRFLSLDESRDGNVRSRNGRHGLGRRRFETSRSVNGLVWVKKGEISDTKAADI